MPYAYFRIQAGPAEEPGIDGGIGEVADAPLATGRPMTVVVVPVENMDRTLELVEENGGKVLERKVAIPGVGWFSSCAEPGGLVFGLIEANPRVS
jgi:hypothetical protein